MKRRALESVPIGIAEKTMLHLLFKPFAERQSEPCGHAKRHRSSSTTDARLDARARKKERADLEAARRASLAD